MSMFKQGDIIKIDQLKNYYVVVSRTSFIKALDFFYVCPLDKSFSEGPTHIRVEGVGKTAGVVACELIKMIDPRERNCRVKDRLTKIDMMIVSDVIQGIMEYD